jgi:hypothetical protein
MICLEIDGSGRLKQTGGIFRFQFEPGNLRNVTNTRLVPDLHMQNAYSNIACRLKV